MSYESVFQHNLRNLTNFSGRDGRAVFWPYAASVFVISFAMMSIVMMPQMLTSMMRIDAASQGTPAQISDVFPNVGLMSFSLGLVAVGFVAFGGAAIARRLHDRDKSAFWGLVPFGFLMLGLVLFPQLFNQFLTGEPDMGLFFLMFTNNVAYLGSLALLVVQLASPGTAGANRYGPPSS